MHFDALDKAIHERYAGTLSQQEVKEASMRVDRLVKLMLAVKLQATAREQKKQS